MQYGWRSCSPGRIGNPTRWLPPYLQIQTTRNLTSDGKSKFWSGRRNTNSRPKTRKQGHLPNRSKRRLIASHLESLTFTIIRAALYYLRWVKGWFIELSRYTGLASFNTICHYSTVSRYDPIIDNDPTHIPRTVFSDRLCSAFRYSWNDFGTSQYGITDFAP